MLIPGTEGGCLCNIRQTVLIALLPEPPVVIPVQHRQICRLIPEPALQPCSLLQQYFRGDAASAQLRDGLGGSILKGRLFRLSVKVGKGAAVAECPDALIQQNGLGQIVRIFSASPSILLKQCPGKAGEAEGLDGIERRRPQCLVQL